MYLDFPSLLFKLIIVISDFDVAHLTIISTPHFIYGNTRVIHLLNPFRFKRMSCRKNTPEFQTALHTRSGGGGASLVYGDVPL
jgi:hypothetical protein